MMSCSEARTGRHRQRYKDQFRLVSGCIPFRFGEVVQGNICDLEKRLLVLMISSPNHKDLVFPKGGWEEDESVTDAACREAFEEAGVKGIILREEPLGEWEFRSKSSQKSCSVGGGCRGYMFALEVTEELDSWPEQGIYQRKWLTTDDAFKFCRYDWMREALERLLRVLSEGHVEETMEQLVKFPLLSGPDTRADQKLSPLCFGTTSSVQHLDRADQKLSPICFGTTSSVQHLDRADQKLSPICFGTASSVQHLDESCNKCAVLG
ncbi:Nudix hydrolase [Actinidia chinensis var. chinensis]|uniref:Nudix hydrolase n=1 Tax=Actinidia chinensis var. chinensis TaxID=1590841 RepID=A0A2R6P2T8_ACTCC|nr:Nudix hydrolase [Actinidia chinensis var. chinensis]